MYIQVGLLDVGIVGFGEVVAGVVVHHYRYFAVGTCLGNQFLHVLAELCHNVAWIGGSMYAFVSE